MDPVIEPTNTAVRPEIVTRAVQLLSASFIIGAIRTLYDHWARILFLVLMIIGVPIAVPLYLAELRTSIPYGSISIVVAILQVIALVLLFTKNSNPWFRKRK